MKIPYWALLFAPLVISFPNAVYASEDKEETVVELLDQAELDTILAPIALYPDTLLSHVLIASTYPLEVVQAARWREDNKDLSEEQVREALEDEEWDPSVKAITPIHSLIEKMSDDLEWLQAIGHAFLTNEEQVLSSVQTLREKAYENGNLESNEYVDVERVEEQIVIETVRREVVYVPYYDTRIVYGPWWHHHYPPYYWPHPVHYRWHGGFYWGHGFHVGVGFYYGGVHWHNRYVIVRPPYYHHKPHYGYPPRYPHHYKKVNSVEYQRWNHNPVHRKGVHYRNPKHQVTYSTHKVKSVPSHNVHKTGTYQNGKVAKTVVQKPVGSKAVKTGMPISGKQTTRYVEHNEVSAALKKSGQKRTTVQPVYSNGTSMKKPVTTHKGNSTHVVKQPTVQSHKSVSATRDVKPVTGGSYKAQQPRNSVTKTMPVQTPNTNKSYSNKSYSNSSKSTKSYSQPSSSHQRSYSQSVSRSPNNSIHRGGKQSGVKAK